MAEPIEMPFGVLTRVGPRNHVSLLDGVKMPTGGSNFGELSGSPKSIKSLCCGELVFFIVLLSLRRNKDACERHSA